MFSFLRVPWANTCMEIVNVAKRKITSIKAESNKNVSPSESQDALIQGFQKALNIKLTQDKLTPFEQHLTEKLYKEKYVTDEWNLYGKTKEK
jgi:lipoate-protein ligase A